MNQSKLVGKNPQVSEPLVHLVRFYCNDLAPTCKKSSPSSKDVTEAEFEEFYKLDYGMNNNGISVLLGSAEQFTFHIKDYNGS